MNDDELEEWAILIYWAVEKLQWKNRRTDYAGIEAMHAFITDYENHK